MKKLKSKIILLIKWKIIEWLGIDKINDDIEELKEIYKNAISMGVDVHFKTESTILIHSYLGGGRLIHIPYKFKNLIELGEFVKELKNKYKIKSQNITVDPSYIDEQILHDIYCDKGDKKWKT